MFSAALTVFFALAFAIALLAFFWGLIVYFWNVGTNEEGRRHGKAILIAGATALVVLMVLFGAVQWVGHKFGAEVFRVN
ncbi:MAG: hypothetical protein AAB449_03235 [Patescibacteria group bacterium]